MEITFPGPRSMVSNLMDLDRRKEFLSKNLMSFGISALDDMAGPITNDDLILVSARTGIGKTELVTNIAKENSLLGKSVAVFSLESFKNEIEARIQYKEYVRLFYNDVNREKNFYPNYRQWMVNEPSQLENYMKYYTDTLEQMQKYKTLSTRYRTDEFTVEDFIKEAVSIHNETDLYIIDHFHFFDFDSQNENSAMKDAIKKLRDASEMVGKPIILVAHLRKTDRRFKSHMPDVDDIHGSSDIIKIATKSIMIASAPNNNLDQSLTQSYIRVAKNRFDGSVCRYVALIDYSFIHNSYRNKYILGELDYDGDFTATPIGSIPRWAKGASREMRM